MTTATIIGIDVSKAYLDLWVLPQGKAGRVEYTDAALPQLVQELTELQPVRIIVEATGGLETVLVSELGAAALPVVVVNPRQVREFARATGRLANCRILRDHPSGCCRGSGCSSASATSGSRRRAGSFPEARTSTTPPSSPP